MVHPATRDDINNRCDGALGEPQAMIHFCLTQAQEHLGEDRPAAAVSPGNYKIAGRWYAMAGRFAQEAAQSRQDENSQVTEESQEVR
jgi:hypothetical protein